MSVINEVPASQVFELIQQFLKENKLNRTLQALEEETGIRIHALESTENLNEDIMTGQWDSVLATLGPLSLPNAVLCGLYEQIALELIEMGELGAAKSLLRQTDVMFELKESSPRRYLALESWVSSLTPVPSEVLFPPNELSKVDRRSKICANLLPRISVAPKSGLLKLLGQALQFRKEHGMIDASEKKVNLFLASPTKLIITGENDDSMVPDELQSVDSPITQHYANISLSANETIEAAVFSPDGAHLVLGTVLGFVYVYDFQTGKLNTTLSYQKDRSFMQMGSAVLCLDFHQSHLLIAGSQGGSISAWDIRSGSRKHHVSAIHPQGITTICFSRDGMQVLTGSFDHTLKLIGLASGRALKEFRGHQSFVNHAIFSDYQGTPVIWSASSDGAIKIWDIRSTNCIRSIYPHHSIASSLGLREMSAVAVYRLRALPKEGLILACTKSPTAHLLRSSDGSIVDTLTAEKDIASFVDIACSPTGQYIYCAGEDNQVYLFRREDSSFLRSFEAVKDADLIGITVHPQQSIMAIYDDAGGVSLWRST